MGECGIRGGYAEIVNMDTAVMAMLQKSISARLCPTVLGQVSVIILLCHNYFLLSVGLHGLGCQSSKARRA